FLLGHYDGENEDADENRDYRALTASMRRYLANNPQIGKKARQEITDILDGLEKLYEILGYDDQKTCANGFKKIDEWLEYDASRVKKNIETTNHVLHAVGNALYSDRFTAIVFLDEIEKHSSALRDCITASELTLAEYNSMPDFENRSIYPNDEDAKKAEFEYIDSASFVTAAESALPFVRGRGTLFSLKMQMNFVYHRGESKRWMKDLNNGLYNNEIPWLMREIEKNIKSYQKTIDKTMELLTLYNFLRDEGNCKNHQSHFHFAEGHYAFKNHDADAMQENLSNKIASYGGSYDFVRYEDTNVLNMLLYADFDPQTYFDIYRLKGLRFEDIKKIYDNAPTYGAERAQEMVMDIQIARSGSLLLPPVFMYHPDYRGLLMHIDGGTPERQKNFAQDFSKWTSANAIRDYYSGAAINIKRFNEIMSQSWFMEYYKGPMFNYNWMNHLVYYDLDWHTVYDFLKIKSEERGEKINSFYGLEKICREHLTSYHTIEPELLDYVRKNNGNVFEFAQKFQGEDFNIRNFVDFFQIPREDFVDLFWDDRLQQPYNINAVYGTSNLAEYYFRFSYKPDYSVSFDLNGVDGRVPLKKTVAAGMRYTLPGAQYTEGLEFSHWNTMRTGVGESFPASATLFMDPPQDMIFYAQWEKLSFMLNYNMNGGLSDPPEEAELFFGDRFYLPYVDEVTPPPGHILFAWSTHQNPELGTDAFFLMPGGPAMMPAHDYTLYAIWERIKFPITYFLNGAKFGFPPQDYPRYDGEEFTVADTQTFVAPDGQKFLHWNTAADGSGIEYFPGQIATTGAQETRLYAIWVDAAE
ncbi:MAG: InlB B-repeat-containing protein, partial [Defluviitaleaceae bacterium]|nr:InlB B-repeat-containing protein [Defluviitaleaceae bacterium]